MSLTGERTKSISLISKSPNAQHPPGLIQEPQSLAITSSRARSSNKSTTAKAGPSLASLSGTATPWTPERTQLLVKSTS